MTDQSDAKGLRQTPFCSLVSTAATSRARRAGLRKQVTADLPIYRAPQAPSGQEKL
jgi:hypothetical protein